LPQESSSFAKADAHSGSDMRSSPALAEPGRERHLRARGEVGLELEQP